jgi:hypothetical protein
VLSSSGAARFFPDRADPIGEKLRVRTAILTVIGVMPPEFTIPLAPDFWVGIGTEEQCVADPRRKTIAELIWLLAPRCFCRTGASSSDSNGFALSAAP